jgi:hypothetical protein
MSQSAERRVEIGFKWHSDSSLCGFHQCHSGSTNWRNTNADSQESLSHKILRQPLKSQAHRAIGMEHYPDWLAERCNAG